MERGKRKIGYLIYEAAEAIKNQAFIALFQEEGKKEGISFAYVSKEEYQEKPLPDLVLNRTREAEVSKWYEKRDVPVLHASLLTQIGNHKFQTLQYLREHLPAQISQTAWAPKSFLIPPEKMKAWELAAMQRERTLLQEIQELWERDGTCILKTVDGHGGSEVIELLSPDHFPQKEQDRFWQELTEKLHLFCQRECILQEKILSDSQDVRVYIVGNRIYQCMLRQGKQDFRSNFSLGGRATPYALSAKERETVEIFLGAFAGETLGLAGLDFIIDRNGTFVFNELEEMVGCRMLYQYTECNVVQDYVRWLSREWHRP